jgi:DNA-binding transcriptional MerR regulator
MMADVLSTGELLSIGRFSRLSGLTVKALRHYDELGLLRPARVDHASGYRFYSLAQARDAEAIRRLRSLGMPLDEMASLLHGTPRSCASGWRSTVPGSRAERSRRSASLPSSIGSSTKRRSWCPTPPAWSSSSR